MFYLNDKQGEHGRKPYSPYCQQAGAPLTDRVLLTKLCFFSKKLASSGSLEAHYAVVNNNDCLWLIYFLICFNQSVLTVTSALSNIQTLPVTIYVHICIVSGHMAAVYNWRVMFENTINHLFFILWQMFFTRGACMLWSSLTHRAQNAGQEPDIDKLIKPLRK